MAFVGLRDIHVALVTTDDATSVIYSTPVRIIGAINVNINPNSASGTLFADDGPMDTASALGEIELEMQVADLSNAQLALLLGHTIGVNGVLLRKATDTAPLLAVGYRALKSNGSYRYVWLTKGMFRPATQEHETKNGDVNFQTPSITGAFLRREFDGAWEAQIDSDDANFGTAGDTWFNKVPGDVSI